MAERVTLGPEGPPNEAGGLLVRPDRPVFKAPAPRTSMLGASGKQLNTHAQRAGAVLGGCQALRVARGGQSVTRATCSD